MENRSPDVDAWMASYDNPQKDLVQAVRETILAADHRVTEAIKWQAPTFVFRGNIASFFPKAQQHVTLMFHTGATLPDPTGVLEGEGATSRSVKILDAADLAAKSAALQGLVRAWVELKES